MEKESYFYIYYNNTKNKYYFHNPIQNQVKWFLPEGTLVLDPKTRNPISNPEIAYYNEDSKLQKKIPSNRSNSLSEPKLERNNKLRRATSTRRLSNLHLLDVSKTIDSIIQDDLLLIYLPESIFRDKITFDFKNFSIDNINKRYNGYLFNRTLIPQEDLLFYSENKNLFPLLKSTDNQFLKLIENLFDFINDYSNNSTNKSIHYFITSIMGTPQIIDEIYLLLFKQIRNNPLQDSIIKLHELILVMTTYFPSSNFIRPFIYHLLSINSFHSNIIISNISKISYCRFLGRCEENLILPIHSERWNNCIPSNIHNFVFGSTLNELIFSQRKISTKCSIPLFLYHLTKLMIEKNVFETIDPFRMNANKIELSLILEYIEMGELIILKKSNLSIIINLFKKWLMDLSLPLIPSNLLKNLEEDFKNSKLNEFLIKLPKIHYDTFGFLIGFLKEFLKFENKNKMTLTQISMLFGVNIVKINSNNALEVKKIVDLSKCLVEYCILNWDTSFIYPLPLEYL